MRSFVDIFLRNSNDVILYIFYIWGNRDTERLSFFSFFFSFSGAETLSDRAWLVLQTYENGIMFKKVQK